MSTAELDREQQHLDLLYDRLDTLRQRSADELARLRRAGNRGNPQARSERDAFATLRENRLAQLEAVEERLCFGRLDLLDGQRRYVGRIGLFDDEQQQLLVDWRAPAATDFYQATAVRPGGVVRRRHLVTRGRAVTGLEDEVLNLDALGEGEAATLAGEGVLLTALNARRTGRMHDIVATIQAEQDRVIRSDLQGVLVVQGGPGTGKTAVALHRAAYLLYTHRERLARSGVLVVGPSPVFLRYIERVLPSLGETGVVMSTPAELFAGVVATAEEPDVTAVLKGELRMAEAVRRAVRNRVRVPDGPKVLDVEGTKIVLDPARVAAAQERARRTGKRHNEARVVFVLDMLEHLADLVSRELGFRLGADDRSDVIADLRGSRDVRRELNLAWPPLTPQSLLSDLYARPDRLAAATPGFSDAERELLRRDRDAAWTLADVVLLDEAAELLGEDDDAARAEARRAAAQRAEEVTYAREVLGQVGGMAAGMLSAESLADRFAERGPELSVAERATRDRSWEFGHVVVDEAQELSPMMWRLLFRRCPGGSMTVVGDVAQTGSAAGTRSWRSVLDPFAKGRWRQVELTVNYRTPAQVMDLAAAVVAAAGMHVRPPKSVRAGDWPPVGQRLEPGEEAAGVVEGVRAELALLGDGRLAVVAPSDGDTGVAALARVLRDALPPGTVGVGAAGLDAPVAVLTVTEAKGLEFDAVVLVDPAAVLAASAHGANDLYVAMTRPTQRLRVLHRGDLPAGLESLA